MMCLLISSTHFKGISSVANIGVCPTEISQSRPTIYLFLLSIDVITSLDGSEIELVNFPASQTISECLPSRRYNAAPVATIKVMKLHRVMIAK
jgi:hypothetical protein